MTTVQAKWAHDGAGDKAAGTLTNDFKGTGRASLCSMTKASVLVPNYDLRSCDPSRLVTSAEQLRLFYMYMW